MDFTYNHKADVYYASSSENFETTWTLGRTGELCELSSDKFNSDTRYAIDSEGGFLRFPLLVFGRFKNDIRLGLDGKMNPITSVMITNVRSICDDIPIFLEADVKEADDIADRNIMFEIRTFQPFTDPWGQIGYYKVQAFRMDDQAGGPTDPEYPDPVIFG